MNLLFGSNWQGTCGRIAAFCLALSATALPITSAAQDFPTKPVRIVVPYSAGGPTDLMARAIAKYMASAGPHAETQDGGLYRARNVGCGHFQQQFQFFGCLSLTQCENSQRIDHPGQSR